MDGKCKLPLDRSLPLVCISSLLSFLCGVGIGANDLTANFAMVVGSGSLNMRQAIIYCTVFELIGAAFMGGHVSGMIRNGIVNPTLFTMNQEMVLIGMTCASFAAALWLYLSTLFGLPVSITHTVVGSILGFAIFSTGSFEYVQPRGIVVIVLSWLLAPLGAALVTSAIFYSMRRYILKVKGKSFEFALRSLPYCLAFSLLVDLAFIMIERPPILSVTLAQYVPLWMQYLLMLMAIVAACNICSTFVFPDLAEEARQQSSFVWESPVVRTEANTVMIQPTQNDDTVAPTSNTGPGTVSVATNVMTAAAETTTASFFEEDTLRRSFFLSSSRSRPSITLNEATLAAATAAAAAAAAASAAGTASGTPIGAEVTRDFSNEESPSSMRSRPIEAKVSTCILSTLEPSDAKFVGQHAVHLSPVTRRRDTDVEMEAARHVASYASLSFSSVNTARMAQAPSNAPSSPMRSAAVVVEATLDSPVSVGSNDEFGEEDWKMDHPMQPIRFGGLLIKPFNPRAEFLYTGLQVVAGSMSSFVHGAVAGANATAAFVILYDTFAQAELNATPLGSSWAVLPAMFGIAIGMFTLGSRLMQTVGVELVTVTPARGWCIQVGGTLVTMILTGIGIPVSLSQSQVGAAIGCGVLDAKLKGVAWGTVSKIIGGWVVTLVISAVTTGVSMWVLSYFYCEKG